MEVYEKVREEIRKHYSDQLIAVYINMDDLIPEEAEEIAHRILAEDLWMPVIACQGEILAEGVLRMRDLVGSLKKLGFEERQNG